MIDSIELVSKRCVNSRWPARWLNEDEEIEPCQCIVECKVQVLISMNGHAPYAYVVTKKEYVKFLKKLTKETNG